MLLALALAASMFLALAPLHASAQGSGVTLDAVAKAMGTTVTSIQYSGSGGVAYTPLAPDATPPMPPSPFTVNLADNITRIGLAVGDIAPLHGRMVPLAELNRTIGKNP